MKDYLRTLIERRKNGELCGIPSYCTAHPIVLEACLELGRKNRQPVLIEATANQVNQFGGYTGMTPADFRDMVYGIADKVGFCREELILGGDHLGPLTWSNLPEKEAMAKAKDLVCAYVKAGFKKIHLDTSMKLADDAAEAPLEDHVIARRGAELYAVCENAYQELLKEKPEEQRPVFVIGSEVPIPGGAQGKEDVISVTKPEELEKTLAAYERAFQEIGIPEAFENIIAVVVQPGVEFDNERFFRYNPAAAELLIRQAQRHGNIVLEGHSTDYQPPEALSEMVRDGIAILKVGPALTFALREGLFALSFMERELLPGNKQAHFPEMLEQLMLTDPVKWEKYYHGTEQERRISRRYSFSDRCRYYLMEPDAESVIARLLDNMNCVHIPQNLLHQFMPLQYEKVICGSLGTTAGELLKDFVAAAAEPYVRACFTGCGSDHQEGEREKA